MPNAQVAAMQPACHAVLVWRHFCTEREVPEQLKAARLDASREQDGNQISHNVAGHNQIRAPLMDHTYCEHQQD
jgi:hypothetical protein